MILFNTTEHTCMLRYILLVQFILNDLYVILLGGDDLLRLLQLLGEELVNSSDSVELGFNILVFLRLRLSLDLNKKG